MKKIIYTAAILCLLTAAVSCKSTKAQKKSSSKKAKAATEAAADEKNAEAPKTSDCADGNYTGWIKGSKKNITERFGKLQLKIKAGIGSYTIYALDENDKTVPVLSTSNEYVTNAFYLKTSKKIYNLVTDNTVRSTARRTTDGAVLNYEIPSVAQVSAYFSCFASQKKKDTDMIKVTVNVRNISDRNDEFAVKAILDTILGEAATYHFYTYEDIPVKNEALYRTLQNQKWFVSKNVNATMQLFFTGAECTTPDLVALANYSTLERNSWEPDMLNYRVFDTVLSYNNSAVCAIWKPIKLAPSESGKVVFYIALSANGAPATGEKYVYSKEFTEVEKEDVETVPKNPSATALDVVTPFAVEDESETITVTPGVTEITQDVSEPASVTEVPNVDFYIKNMTKEHLTPEYIQSLLDRIAALEEDSPSLNRQELLQLNAELDAILTYLRQ